ncbi:ABC transporter permease [Nonomuraea sp. NPDC049269]|uniref:ABC transporter permease n=1 Tax=Nonomuraea sp. NPDC049269 TaxID=3364349 RepID=UPI00372074A3
MTAPLAPATSVLQMAQPKRNLKLWIGLAILAVYVLVAVLAPWLRPSDPLHQDVVNALQGPSGSHLLGTDELGRDVLSRIITATRLDLSLAVLAVLLPCLLGSILGLLAGYLGGWVDAVVMRCSDLLQAFPTYILMIVLVFSLGPGMRSLLISFTVVGWVVYARLMRAEVARIRDAEYVVAAITAGFRTPRIVVRHVLPNAYRQSMLYLSSDLVFAVSALAAFSFLGFGIQQPTPEWGNLIASAQPYLADAPRLTLVPGVVITVLALGLALVGDYLQERTGER